MTTTTYNTITTRTYDNIICTVTSAPKLGNNQYGVYAYCGAHIRNSKDDPGEFITLFARYNLDQFMADFGSNVGNLVVVSGHFNKANGGTLNNGTPKNATVNGTRLLRVIAESKRNLEAKAAAGLQATAPRAAQAMTDEQRIALAQKILPEGMHVHANPGYGSALAGKAEALIG
jgi:hypothetical protein